MRRHATLLGILSLYFGLYSFVAYQQVQGLTGYQAWTPFLVSILLFGVLLIITAYRAVQWVQTRKEADVIDLEGVEYFF